MNYRAISPSPTHPYVAEKSVRFQFARHKRIRFFYGDDDDDDEQICMQNLICYVVHSLRTMQIILCLNEKQKDYRTPSTHLYSTILIYE